MEKLYPVFSLLLFQAQFCLLRTTADLYRVQKEEKNQQFFLVYNINHLPTETTPSLTRKSS